MTGSHRAATRLIGWREQIALPDLGIASLKAKVDTGARTSAIHAVDVQEFVKGGEKWISFRVPLAHLPRQQSCVAPVFDQREIKNTSGRAESRHVIRTRLVLGRRHWHIELSLANREEMGFDLILGRTAIRGHGLLVDPGRSYLSGLPQALPTKQLTIDNRRARNIPSADSRATNHYAMEEEE